MKGWSVNKWHRYLLSGIFLAAQLVAIAHLPVHTLESLQAAYGLVSDEHSVQLEQCSICLAADYLDSSSVNSTPQVTAFLPLLSTTAQAVDGLKAPSFSLYIARAPPAFS